MTTEREIIRKKPSFSSDCPL